MPTSMPFLAWMGESVHFSHSTCSAKREKSKCVLLTLGTPLAWCLFAQALSIALSVLPCSEAWAFRKP